MAKRSVESVITKLGPRFGEHGTKWLRDVSTRVVGARALQDWATAQAILWGSAAVISVRMQERSDTALKVYGSLIAALAELES